MQLDLMTKIRDHKIYENRARFQKHAAQPMNFSSFQIQEYLKASAFRCVSSCILTILLHVAAFESFYVTWIWAISCQESF